MINKSKYFGKKVAIIAAMSTSGETGGAERFYSGILNAFIDEGCIAELVNVYADESTFECIKDNYKTCAELDLSKYDLVISTKSPTYAVNHPRHVLYLMHTVRVFYDMYEEVFPWAGDELNSQRQEIIKLDTNIMGAIDKRFSIGYEVSSRLEKWNGFGAEVLHPPLGMNRFIAGPSGDYFFMPGRLHSWKRVHLAINALKESSLEIPLYIAGTGEAEEELKALADNDSRIKFLGRVSDEELISLYSNSLAVLFLPLREDYGYITLEAFASSKPVITCTDSGEPVHFVQKNNAGIVCSPTAEGVKLAMEFLFQNRETAQTMGVSGAVAISHITWPHVVNKLLDAGFNECDVSASNHDIGELKVAVIDMQPIDPPVGGGRLRLLGLYHGLGEKISARYVGSYDWPGENFRRHKLTPSLEEIDVPLSQEHHAEAIKFSHLSGGKGVIDISFPRLGYLSPEYLNHAKSAIKWADVVIFSHPWCYPGLAEILEPEKLVVYDSQNVEALLRAQLLDKSNPFEYELVKDVVRSECEIGARSSLVLACSEEDKNIFERVYGWSNVEIVPNGVMSSAIIPSNKSSRKIARIKLEQPTDAVLAIFVGSDYQPNAEAAQFIISTLSNELPEVRFILAGGICARFSGKKLPGNVFLTGYLSEEDKVNWLLASDFAVNPMFSGSGTNIKMFDFMAAGLPVVSTDVGARGIYGGDSDGLVIASKENYSTKIKELLNSESLNELGMRNRLRVEDDFSWEKISPKLGLLLKSTWKDQIRKNWDSKNFANSYRNSKFHLAHIGTTGLKCGIGEYTLLLAKHLGDMGVSNYFVSCTTPSHQPNLLDLGIKGEIGWFYDDVTWSKSTVRDGIVHYLRNIGADSILVQYHPAFFAAEVLESIISDARASGMAIAVVVHNFSLCNIPVFRRISQDGVTLFSHNKFEIKSAAAENVNLSLLPFGVEVNSSLAAKSILSRDYSSSPPIIASTGFVRAHKGIPSLIRAIHLLKSEFPGVKLLLQCSLYPSLDSQVEMEKCLEIIDQLGLDDDVIFDAAFHPISAVYEKLSIADIAVLPYDASNEGGSAAAATCLGSGLPLIVSTSVIFEDLRSAVYTISDNSPEVIASAIVRHLKSPSLYDELAERGYRYCVENSWQVTGSHIVSALDDFRNIPSTWKIVDIDSMRPGDRRFSGVDERLRSQVGELKSDGSISTTNRAGALIFGPYISLKSGAYSVRVVGSIGAAGLDGAAMDVVCNAGSNVLVQSQLIESSPGCLNLSIEFKLLESCSDLEVRVWVNSLTELSISFIQISPARLIGNHLVGDFPLVSANSSDDKILCDKFERSVNSVAIADSNLNASALFLDLASGAQDVSSIKSHDEFFDVVLQDEKNDCIDVGGRVEHFDSISSINAPLPIVAVEKGAGKYFIQGGLRKNKGKKRR